MNNNDFNIYVDEFRKQIEKISKLSTQPSYKEDKMNFEDKVSSCVTENFSLNPVIPKATIRPLIQYSQLCKVSSRTPNFT